MTRKRPSPLSFAAVLALSARGSEPGAPIDAPSEPPLAASSPAELAASAGAEDGIDDFLLEQYPDAGEVSHSLARNGLNGDGADEAISIRSVPNSAVPEAATCWC
ncbi:MAG TPA: hypothetical protein VHN58_01960 [Croceicoccus sp.]|nr:hypothetical protein [Croceicoccus sp.]